MKSWIKHLWNDEDAFKASLRAVGKWLVVLLGGLVATGKIPSDGWGGIVGSILVAAGAAYPTVPLGKVNSAPSINLLSEKLRVVDANVKKVANATDVSIVAPEDRKY